VSEKRVEGVEHDEENCEQHKGFFSVTLFIYLHFSAFCRHFLHHCLIYVNHKYLFFVCEKFMDEFFSRLTLTLLADFLQLEFLSGVFLVLERS